MKAYHLRALVACVSIFGFAGQMTLAKAPKKAPAKVSNKKGAQPGPLSLVGDMRSSLIYIVKNSKDVSPKAKQAKPYWMALNSAWDGLDLMEEGIKKKNASMLTGLEDTGRGITQLAASWGMLRGAYPKSTVGRGVSSLHSAYEMYIEHYGPHVARFKKKGPLTAKEKAQMERSGKQLDTMFANLKKVNSKAKPKSYQSRMIQDIAGLVNKLDNVRSKGKGRLGYAAYMYQWGRLQNTMWAYSEIAADLFPDFYDSAWSTLETDIEAMDTCFGSEEEQFENYADWDYTEDTIEDYDNYYEETGVVDEVSDEDEKEYADDVADYDEDAAVEEDEDLEEEADEELSDEESEGEDSLADDVGDSDGDDDGDGVADEEDTDDDNDGVCDEQDTDDDGDGVADEEDADTEEEEAEEEAEEDDNGISEACEDPGCSGGGCDGGCSDGGGGCCEE